MPHELPRLGARRGEPHAIHHIIKPALQQGHEVFPGHSALPFRQGEEAAEGHFQHPIDASQFLLFA